jgi:TP901 family phage tail tape measure protein
MAITAGAVVIELSLDTKKAITQLNTFKENMKTNFESIGTSLDAMGVKAALVGNHLVASAKKGYDANRALLAEMRRVRGGMDGITNASRRMATNSGKAYATGPITKYNRNLKQTGAVMQSVHGRLIILSTAITATFGKAIKIGAIFENEMRKVKAVVGATEQELMDLTNTARMLGKSTTFMATEVARGMKILGQAGFSTRQIKAAIGDVLDLARAGSVTLERAAQVMISVGKTFEVAAGDIANVGDILIATANNSATNVDLLGASFSFVGSTAVSTGQKLKGIATLLGVLANRGLRGTKAGTALNEALLRLSQNKTVERMNAMGVAVEDLEGNMRPLERIFLDLKKATEGLSAVEQAGLFIDVFGRRGARAGLLIARAGEDVGVMANILENVGGVANRTARDMEKDLLSKFRLLKSAAEDLAEAFKTALAPSLIEATKYMREMAIYSSDLIRTFPQVAKVVGALAGVLAVLAAALVGFKYIIIPIIESAKYIAGAFTSMGGAAGKATGGVTLLGRGVAILKGAFTAIATIGGALIKTIFGGLITKIGTAVPLLGRLGTAFMALNAGATAFSTTIAGTIVTIAAATVAYGALIYYIGKTAVAIVDLIAAEADAEVSKQKYIDKVKEMAKEEALSAKAATKLATKKIQELRDQGKTAEEVQQELRKMAKVASGQAVMYNNRSKVVVLEEEIALYKKLAQDQLAYAKALLRADAQAIASTKEKISVAQLERAAMKQKRQLKALQEQHEEMQKAEERHQDAMARIREQAQNERERRSFRKRVSSNPRYAEERARARKAELEREIGYAQKFKAIYTDMAKTQTSAQLVEKIKEKQKAILDLTKKRAREEKNIQTAIEAQKRSLDALLAREAKGRAEKNKDFDKNRAQYLKTEALKARIEERKDQFRQDFEGVKSTVSADGAVGGSLSERLGATDPNIRLNQKALANQKVQIGLMRRQAEAAEKTYQKLEADYITKWGK